MKLYTGYESWSELDLLTGVIVGEARGEPTAGKIGVALVVKNRAEQPGWWGRNWREVILASKQFSCWEDINAERIVAARRAQDTVWKICRQVAINAYLDLIEDRIGKPTHYHADYVRPKWANSLERLAQIGRHIFYR